MGPGVQNYVAIGSGVSAPQIRDFAVPFDVTSFYVRFESSRKATASTPKRILMQHTSKYVVPGKKLPLGST